LVEQRVMAIDYGAKRIGIAVTDPLNMFAYPLTTLLNDSKFWNNLCSLITEYNVVQLVLGYPLKENGSESSSTKLVQKFYEELIKKISIPVELADERYSSDIAKQRIIASVSSKQKRRDKSLVDKNAAAVILEDYMNTKNR
jgi:putative holliday junction resolvase